MDQKLESEKLISEYLRRLAIMGRSPGTARTYRIEIRKMFRYFYAKRETGSVTKRETGSGLYNLQSP